MKLRLLLTFACRFAVGWALSIGLLATLLADVPRINSSGHPQSVCIIDGQSTSFKVTAVGTAPFQYQWQFNGADLTDKTNATLSIQPVRPENGGDYQVVVSNTEGSVTSRVARLHVLPPPASLLARIFTNSSNQRLPYRLWIPTNHLSEAPLPLVLFLHGAGERGSDNLAQLAGQPHALSFISYQNQVAHPCFFVAPQCPANSDWTAQGILNLLGGVLTNLLAQYSIDTNRIYVSGLSMGGYGSWALLAARPGVFAAAAPMCGGASINIAPIIKKTPIWDFHSADDGTVPVSNSRDLMQALRAQGASTIYTEYASAGHFSWVPAYSTQDLIDWMMAQSLQATSPTEPRILLPPPFEKPVLRGQAGFFWLQGQVAAFDEPVTSVAWTNLTMRLGGTGVGTNDWSVLNLPLRQPQTNSLVLLARLTSFAPQYGGSTTISRTLFVRGLPPLRLALQTDAGKVHLAWAGAEPPYVIQSTTNPVSGPWVTVSTNALSPIEFTSERPMEFYRVFCPE